MRMRVFGSCKPNHYLQRPRDAAIRQKLLEGGEAVTEARTTDGAPGTDGVILTAVRPRKLGKVKRSRGTGGGQLILHRDRFI